VTGVTLAAVTGATLFTTIGAWTKTGFFTSEILQVSFFLIGAETGGVGGFFSSLVIFGSSFFFSYAFGTAITFGTTGAAAATGAATRTGFATETFSNGTSTFLDSTLT